MHRKPLPLPPQDNPQVQEYTSAVKRGLKDYYVAPSAKGWSVRRASAKTGRDFSSKAEALAYAKESAANQADVVVHGEDGSVTLAASK